MSLSFEKSLDQAVIQRVGYTLLDLLSDIGGIQSILVSGIAILVSIWNYNNFDNHFLTNFFKLKVENDKSFKTNRIDHKLKSKDFVPTKICNI